MNNYYQKLNLPNVVLDIEELKNIKRNNLVRGYVSILTDFEYLINPELSYIFKQLSIQPNTLIVFGHENNKNFKTNPNVHTDIFKQDNQWIKVPFAINWEITNTPVEFKWYDVSNYKEFYPVLKDSTELGYLLANGIHYGERYKLGEPNISGTFTTIESFTFNQNEPVMVNTGIAHGVTYSGFEDRLNVSLRFDVKDIPSWESAVEKFKQQVL